MKMRNTFVMIAAGVALSGAVLSGCNNNGSTSTTRSTDEAAVRRPAISLTGPGRDVMVGDTATFMASTANTYGRDAKIKWTSTAGKVSTDQGGSVARVRFDESGVYTVKATLEIDGTPVQTESVDVRVNPIK